MDQPLFSFQYGGKPFLAAEGLQQRVTERGGGTLETVFSHPDGLTVTQTVRVFPGYHAKQWALTFENKAQSDSRSLTELHDADIVLKEYNAHYAPKTPHFSPADTCAFVWHTVGACEGARDEFMAVRDRLPPGEERHYGCKRGRSCQGTAPYFDLNDGERGALIAIGWTGQWMCSFKAENKAVAFRAGLEDAAFYLRPGEKVRTASILVMAYEDGRERAHNAFRRLIREYISPLGRNGMPEHGPLCVEGWGALSSVNMIKRMKRLRAAKIPFEYYWIDAGWYGHSQSDCLNEFVGDWAEHTGSWNVNPFPHPDGLADVAKAARENGYRMLLWIEPERAVRGTDWQRVHPDWFLESEPGCERLLLNLGHPEAWQATFEMIDGYIKKLGLDCYRQDFNYEPLDAWRQNDEPGRKGLCEIGHIMGLYRLWDALLEANPGLLIDNCASGGRRNDIEMMARAVPLWRSDAQCVGDCAPEVAQCHMTHYSAWLPYTGTSMGLVEADQYRMRSCYAPALVSPAWAYAEPCADDAQTARMKPLYDEYMRVRPYLSCDFYSLAGDSLTDDAWCAWQYDRPEHGDGLLLAFRRPLAVYESARLVFRGLDERADYELRDADTGETRLLTGAVLTAGWLTTIPNRRQSRLVFYHKV